MINVMVSYSVEKDFSSKNRENIAEFLKDFESLNQKKFSYQILAKDENFFVHISKYADEDIQKELLQIPSFLKFQKMRDENLLEQPKIEIFQLEGSSGNY